MKYKTYVILDPRDNVPVYVGQSSCFQLRKESHLSCAMGKRPNIVGINIETYLFDLHAIGYMPKFEIIEECSSEEESLKSELEYIKIIVKKGIPLLNNWKEHKRINKERFGKQYKQYFTKRLLAKNLEELKSLTLEMENINHQLP
jgi:hypothetical protein